MKTEQNCGGVCGCEGSQECKFPESPAWQKYYADLERHEKHYESIRPDEEQKAALSEWEMSRSCFAPNKPGYFRANND